MGHIVRDGRRFDRQWVLADDYAADELDAAGYREIKRERRGLGGGRLWVLMEAELEPHDTVADAWQVARGADYDKLSATDRAMVDCMRDLSEGDA